MTLNEMQVNFVKWAFSRYSVLLQAPAGSGKTIAVYTLFRLWENKLAFKRMLVIAKPKTLQAWTKKSNNIYSYSQYSVRSKKDQSHLSSQAQVICISTTMLNKVRLTAGFLRTFDTLVVDELHDFRVYKNTTSINLKKVTDFFHARQKAQQDSPRIVTLTATPIFKALENLYTMFSYIQPGIFGKYYQFEDRYLITQLRGSNSSYGRVYNAAGSSRIKQKIQFKEIIGYKNQEELYQRIDGYIFEWSDHRFVFEYKLRYFTLDKEEMRVYREAVRGLGLDNVYTITVQDKNGNLREFTKTQTETFYDIKGNHVSPKDLSVNDFIRIAEQPFKVLSKTESKGVGQHSVRLIKSQQVTSTSRSKLDALVDVVKSRDTGAMVYCAYHSSVDAVYRRLAQESLGRRLVKITGRSSRVASTLASLNPNDIVIITKVAQQSLDFYFERIILYEQVTNPGSIEQLLGRLTRHDSPFTNIEVIFMLRLKSVEEYYYERLRFLLRNNAYKVYSDNIPRSKTLGHLPEESIDISLLKETLLWN